MADQHQRLPSLTEPIIGEYMFIPTVRAWKSPLMTSRVRFCRKCFRWLPHRFFYRRTIEIGGGVTYCRVCHRRVMRRLSKEHREWGRRAQAKYHANPENRAKTVARAQVRQAVKRGRHGWSRPLYPEPCVICGSTKRVHGHHESYHRPLDVIWLCPTHHKQLHKGLLALPEEAGHGARNQ